MASKNPTGMYGKFERKEYLFEAFMPKTTDEECEFFVKVSEHGHDLFQFHIPLSYLPMYGADPGDVLMLGDVTEDVLEILPENMSEFGFEKLNSVSKKYGVRFDSMCS